MISFRYKFYDIIVFEYWKSVKAGKSRVKGFVLGSKLPSPELALNTKSSSSAQDFRRSLAAGGPVGL